MSQDDIEAIMREIELLRNIDHPNVVKLHDLKGDDNNLYMIFEYMAGGTLRQRMYDLKEPLSEEETYQIISPIVDAMEYCHAEGIVHRDLKVATDKPA